MVDSCKQVVTQKKDETTPMIVPIFINTPTGTIAVFGHEQVSRKMLELLGISFSHDAFESIYHGVKSVVFRIDGYPKKDGKMHCSNYAPDNGGITINMVKTLELSIERSMDNPETSLMASWWIEMLLNIGHELHHAVRYETKRDEFAADETLLVKEEELAENYSNELITALAQEYDIEPPAITKEVWFNSQISELLNGKDETDTWSKAQKEMLDKNIMWKTTPDSKEEIVIHTFKDLICLIKKGDVADEEWNKPTIVIPSGIKTLDEQVNGKKVVTNTPEAVNTTQQVNNEEQITPVDDVDELEDYYQGESTPTTQNQTISIQNNDFINQQAAQPCLIAGQHDATTISRIAKQVYMKMYNHIFTNCTPTLNSDVGFNNPEAIISTPLLLTDEEKTIFTSMNHNDINGRWCTDIPTTNGLVGKIMKNTRLPAYEVMLTVHGQIHKRIFIPQNPAKTNAAGQLTQRAQEARAGNAIAYVIIPSNGPSTTYGPSIINNTYKAPNAA